MSDFRPLLTFVVRETPVPQGSMIPVTPRGGGRTFVVPDNASALKPWRRDVAAAAASAIEYAQTGGSEFPLDGPIVVDAVFTWKKPQSAPKTRPSYPATIPDVDKLLRALLDGLATGGVYVNDSRVCRVVGTKAYPLEHVRALDVPGVHVVIARHPLPLGIDLDEICPAPRPRAAALRAAEQEVLL